MTVFYDRRQLEKDEKASLAVFAFKSFESRGRRLREKEHPYRTAFQRDRDRIVHSSAFRRLEYKTQVFVNHEGDYYRTRLTHTLEVHQIADAISRVLRLNRDLVSSIALAHDLGHTPFGHAGEEELESLMHEHGGFDHNLQSLRVVDFLEEQYVEFRGLNLTFETRVGLLKSRKLFEKAGNLGIEMFSQFKGPCLESQVVDASDEIAYDNHDIDDGLMSGLLQERDLDKIALWREAKHKLGRRLSDKPEVRRCQIIRALINMEVTDLLTTSKKNILRAKLATPLDAMKRAEPLVVFSSPMSKKRSELRGFLMEKLYSHYRVVRMTDKAQRFVRSLFNVYLSRPEQLPPSSRQRLESEGAERVICDYIAGMTDRYAQDEYKKFFEPYEKV